MAFSDPQTVTINAVPYSLARIVTEARKGIYTDATGVVRMTPSQVANGRLSHVVTLGQSKIAADPISAVNKQIAASWQLSAIRPLVGFSTTEMVNGLTALVTWLSASSYANGIKLFNGES